MKTMQTNDRRASEHQPIYFSPCHSISTTDALLRLACVLAVLACVQGLIWLAYRYQVLLPFVSVIAGTTALREVVNAFFDEDIAKAAGIEQRDISDRIRHEYHHRQKQNRL